MKKEDNIAQIKLGIILGLIMVTPTLIFILCCWLIKG